MEEPKIILFGGKEYIPKEYFDEYCRQSIKWSVEDFESRANELEEFYIENDPNTVLPIYERAVFEDELESMIQHHDCNLGITWDTIDYYLDTYCKL
jgi:hypothetical protein